MRNSLLTLWDLLTVPPTAALSGRCKPSKAPAPPESKVVKQKSKVRMQFRYDQMTRDMLAHHGVRVRRWRNSMSGIAWQVYYKDGHIARLIEAPRPKGPMSAAIFLHEIGHHAIGFNVYKPRCLEEYHAWAFSLQQMDALGLNITDAVRQRVHMSLCYAVHKAQRRGIRQIPPELVAYTRPWRPR